MIKVLSIFSARTLQLPAGETSRLETISVSNGDRKAVTFANSASQYAILNITPWPNSYQGTGTLSLVLDCIMDSATSGSVVMTAEVEAITPGDSTDLDSAASFDSTNSSLTSVANAAGKLFSITISLGNKDSVAVGDAVRIRITRLGSHGSDTATGTLRLLGGSVSENVSTLDLTSATTVSVVNINASGFFIGDGSQLTNLPPGPQGEQGFQGDTGGPQGDQGEQGDQGDIGAQGDQGNQGDQGYQGDSGPQGDQGNQGDASTEPGPQGDKGDQGDVGAQGEQGNQGDASTEPGPQGDQGDIGAQGEQGNTGADGVSLIWRGEWADFTSYAVNDLVRGTAGTYICIQSHTSNEGAFNNHPESHPGYTTYWADFAKDGIEGPIGEQGDPGPQGEQGDQGDVGDQGDIGDQGAQGEQGEAGVSNEPGPQGDQGDTGAQGDQGDQGDQGAQGEQGDQGDQGDQGPQGEQGEPGP